MMNKGRGSNSSKPDEGNVERSIDVVGNIVGFDPTSLGSSPRWTSIFVIYLFVLPGPPRLRRVAHIFAIVCSSCLPGLVLETDMKKTKKSRSIWDSNPGKLDQNQLCCQLHQWTARCCRHLALNYLNLYLIRPLATSPNRVPTHAHHQLSPTT